MSRMGGLVRRRPLLTGGFTVGVLAITGIPPMNGFASLGLIHEGVRESGQPVLFVAVLAAQVLTIAALGRAAYLTFYRRRPEPYEHLEALRPGMRVTLLALGAGCVAFGVLPGAVVNNMAAPAASVVLHPAAYAQGVLAATADVPREPVSFSYGNWPDLLVTLLTAALGFALAARQIRAPMPRVIRYLRAVHTGSVNDYAAFAAAGLLIGAVVVLA